MGDAWKALIGIDVQQRPGTYTMRAAARVGSTMLAGERRLTVAAKQFTTRRLTVAPAFVIRHPMSNVESGRKRH